MSHSLIIDCDINSSSLFDNSSSASNATPTQENDFNRESQFKPHIIQANVQLFYNESSTTQSDDSTTWQCCVFGVPIEATQEDISNFLEPYLSGFSKVIVIANQAVTASHIILLYFHNKATMISFSKLYNNLHFPTYCDSASCLVLAISKIIIEADNHSPKGAEAKMIDKETNSIGTRATGTLSCASLGSMEYKSTTVETCITSSAEPASTITSNPISSTAPVATGGALSPPPSELDSSTSTTSNTIDDNNSSIFPLNICQPSIILTENNLPNSSSSTHCNNTLVTANATTTDNNNNPNKNQQCTLNDSRTGPGIGVRLPICTICLRRLQRSSSGISYTRSDFIGDPSVYTLRKDCQICFLFDESSRPHRRCHDCGLRENLWICLLCSFMGCGRYTAQHAKRHFDESRHSFSLELATGRIWDYVHDTYVHSDLFPSDCPFHFSMPHETETGTTNRTTAPPPSSSNSSITTLSSNNSNSNTTANESQADQGLSSPPPIPSTALAAWDHSDDPNSTNPNTSGNPRWVLTKAVTTNRVIRNVYRDTHLTGNATSTTATAADSNSLLLSSNTALSKLGNLRGDYELLLDSQLQTQRLHFEKLLARETMNALELELLSATSTSINPGISTTSNNTISNSSTATSTTGILESKISTNSDTNSITSTTTTGTTPKEFADINWEFIEEEKLQISKQEYEYYQLLNTLRERESEVNQLRKTNNTLIKDQKAQRTLLADTQLRIQQTKEKCKAETEELEQEITDLSFYLCVRDNLSTADAQIRGEIEEGTIVLAPTNSSSRRDNNKSNLNRKKKEKRK